MASTNPDAPLPLDKARQLAPLIRSCAEQIEQARELPRPLFEALADAGLFRLALPRSLGGQEIDLPTYVEVMEELGKADASTAWCINQGAIFATFATRLPREVAHLIWIETPRSVVANTPTPGARAIPVEGGYRVTGRMGFSSGSRHAAWLAAQAQIIEDGRPRLLPDGEPETRYLLLPAAEGEILDTWDVHGLRGTGTHHFRVNDVFVPEARTFLTTAPPLGEPGPLYLFPYTLLYALGDAAIALGVARTALEAFVELASAKTPQRASGLLREQAMAQADVGLAEAQLRAGRALLTETIREVWEAACATGDLRLDQRASIRLTTTHAIWLAVEVVDALYNAAGATAIFRSSPIQRCFQDIHVITQHIQARRTNYELVGRFLLGVETDLQRL